MEIDHDVTIRLLFFAQSKELAGIRECWFQVPKKINYYKLLDLIAEKYNLATIKNNVLLAKNEEVCDGSNDVEFTEKDNLAVIPPLSGG